MNCYLQSRYQAHWLYSLLAWSQGILTWGKVFLAFILVYGAAVSIIAAMDTESLVTFIITLFPYLIYAVAEYCTFNFISNALYVVASFHENSAIATNVALYRAAKEENKI